MGRPPFNRPAANTDEKASQQTFPSIHPTQPTLDVTTDGRVFTLTKALPAGWSFGCPVFPPDGSGIVMVGWPKVEERRMGLIYYSTRPSTLFFVPGPNEKSSLAWVLPAMPLTPNDHSARCPRFSPDGRTMLYTTSEEKRAQWTLRVWPVSISALRRAPVSDQRRMLWSWEVPAHKEKGSEADAVVMGGRWAGVEVGCLGCCGHGRPLDRGGSGMPRMLWS